MSIRCRTIVSVLAGALLFTPAWSAHAEEATPPAASDDATESLVPFAPQPSYDTLRLFDGSSIQEYHLLVDWVPAFVATPDGGAWLFFGAQAHDNQGYGPRKIFASRFDPTEQIWLPAVAMPGSETQFAPAAEVGPDGTVHVVYSDATTGAGPSSTLVYTRSDGKGGWTEPLAIAPDPAAGFQMMASLAVDAAGGVHVLWRDQRLASDGLRAAHPANGDLFESDFADGEWSTPSKVLERPDDTVVAGWPHIAGSGDRLVAVWSVYTRTGTDTMGNATAVQWASRPLDDPAAWSAAQTIVSDGEGDIGGRLIDLAHDPDGNLALVSGDFDKGANVLSVYRLDSGAEAWSAPLEIASGDFGYMPSATFDGDGKLIVIFNAGRNRNVEIGAVAVGAEQDGPISPVLLSPAEDGLQARGAVTTAADGEIWVAYMHQPDVNSAATELRVLRGADVTTKP